MNELKLKDFVVRYWIKEGPVIDIKFKFQDKEYESDLVIEDYPQFVSRYTDFYNVNISDLNGDLSRKNVTWMFNNDNEKKWFEDCISIVFGFIQDKLKEFPGCYMDYFKGMEEHQHTFDMKRLEDWLTCKAIHIVMKTRLEYKPEFKFEPLHLKRPYVTVKIKVSRSIGSYACHPHLRTLIERGSTLIDALELYRKFRPGQIPPDNENYLFYIDDAENCSSNGIYEDTEIRIVRLKPRKRKNP